MRSLFTPFFAIVILLILTTVNGSRKCSVSQPKAHLQCKKYCISQGYETGNCLEGFCQCMIPSRMVSTLEVHYNTTHFYALIFKHI